MNAERPAVASGKKIKVVVALAVLTVTSCTIPRVFYHNVVDPVLYPTEQPPKTVQLRAALPPELGATYHANQNTVLDVHAQAGALKGWVPERDDYKLGVGLSAHAVKQLGMLNFGLGAGVDAGRSVGRNGKNQDGDSTHELRPDEGQLSEHELGLSQYYAQAVLGLNVDSQWGFGFVRKIGRTRVDVESGTVIRGFGAQETRESIAGKRMDFIFNEIDFVLRFDGPEVDTQFQLRVRGDNEELFVTNLDLTLLLSYTLPSGKAASDQ